MYPDPGPIHTASGNYQPSAKTQSIATNRAVTFEDEWLQEGGKERENKARYERGINARLLFYLLERSS